VLKDPIQIIDPASLVGNSRETFHKSGTDGSNPVPSSGESANFRFLASIIRGRNPAGGAPLARRSTRPAVDILEGLIRQGIDRDTAEESADNPVAPRRPKAAYSSVLCAYIAHHKTTAVQEMLFACSRKAKEVAVVLRLKQFRPHEAMKALAKEAEPQSAYAVLEGQLLPSRAPRNAGPTADRRAMRAVSDEMVLTLSATGTADDVAARISALLKAGLKQAVLFPLAVDGDASGAILRTIEALS